jgi:O-antigen biosynthesis protein
VSVSLIIVSYNKRPYTELCLRGQLACEPRADEVIVVDNGSTDGSMEALHGSLSREYAAAGVPLTVIANGRNEGACTARNQALAVATGGLIGFLDNDIAVRRRDWLGTLGAVLEREPRAGIVGPKLLFPFAPYDIECAGAAISATGRVQYRGRGQAHGAPALNRPTEVQCLISAAWLMRREVHEQIGGLDEAYSPAQFEDFDFCYRARAAGWLVLYEPAAELYHYENVTTAGSPDVKFTYLTMKNWATFKQRWQHAYAAEDGPADSECQWLKLPTKPLEETGTPPVL